MFLATQMELRLFERHHRHPRLPARRRQKKRLWARPERQFLENRGFQIFSRKKINCNLVMYLAGVSRFCKCWAKAEWGQCTKLSIERWITLSR